ncbi:MAG: lysophospholipid acyltransferase family protein [Halioglobus sp.]
MSFYRAIAWLPFPVLYFFAWLAYLLLYYVAGYRRAVVKQNLSRAFPQKSDGEIKNLAKKFYRQLCQVAFEILKARRMSKDDFRERVTLANPELLQEYSNNFTESVIVLSIHQGNWEWMLHGATTALDIPIDPVYKPLHNKTVDQLIFDIRSQFGSRPLSMAESVKDIVRRRKEFRIFVMLADQSPIRSERGHWTEFMNQQAAFYLGAETIAKMTRFPVLYVQCHRTKPGYYTIEFHEVAKPPYDKQSHQITERYVALAEQAIRQEPESWLWSNRRWKRDPVAEKALSEEQKID